MLDHDLHHGSRRVSRRQILSGAFAIAAGGGTWWLLGSESPAGPVTTDRFGDQNQTLPRGQLPDFARSANSQVQEAYRYALERGEPLEYIPCFCGCRNIGHRHNRDCYIKSFNRDGTVTYTSHSATRAICLNITRDVMRLQAEGKPLSEVRAFIDQTYGKAGPSTPTLKPK